MADPQHMSGGGAVAALTLSGAAATAELVVTLASRRKSLAKHRPELVELLTQIQMLKHEFLSAADSDLAALDQLLAAQRATKQATAAEDRRAAEERYQAALAAAARAPLDMSQRAATLLQLIQQALPFATRFTVSDLGAAGALAVGAVEAALLTSEVNLALLGDNRPQDLADQVQQVRDESRRRADDIVRMSRERIADKGKGQARDPNT